MKTRRDTLGLLTKSAVAVGTMGIGAGLLRSCTPSADILAEQNLTFVTPPVTGDKIVRAFDQVILIRRMTPTDQQIVSSLIRDEEAGLFKPRSAPERHAGNMLYPLVGDGADLFVISLISPRGCIVEIDLGDYGDERGFFCPCIGDHFDALGRFRKGYTGQNMHIPKTVLLADGTLEIQSLSQNQFPGGGAT